MMVGFGLVLQILNIGKYVKAKGLVGLYVSYIVRAAVTVNSA